MPGLEDRDLRLTPVQQCIWDTLRQGHPYTLDDLRSCLWDDHGSSRNVREHIYAIRKQLRQHAETILCVIHNRTVHYQYVALRGAAAAF